MIQMQGFGERESGDRSISRAEAMVAGSFRSVLEGVTVGERVESSEGLQDALRAMEHFIPEVLREVHPEWKAESLDGVLPLMVRGTGEREVELLGQGILISDQALVPIHVAFQIDAAEDKFNWLECRLGEKGPQGMVRRPYDSQNSGLKQLVEFEENIEAIPWAYAVAYGEKGRSF